MRNFFGRFRKLEGVVTLVADSTQEAGGREPGTFIKDPGFARTISNNNAIPKVRASMRRQSMKPVQYFGNT